MPVNLYNTQKVRGFQQTRVKYSKESVEIRWAYGFGNHEYFKLKIYQLPEISSGKSL